MLLKEANSTASSSNRAAAATVPAGFVLLHHGWCLLATISSKPHHGRFPKCRLFLVRRLYLVGRLFLMRRWFLLATSSF
jgi:hypothetical protein